MFASQIETYYCPHIIPHHSNFSLPKRDDKNLIPKVFYSFNLKINIIDRDSCFLFSMLPVVVCQHCFVVLNEDVHTCFAGCAPCDKNGGFALIDYQMLTEF